MGLGLSVYTVWQLARITAPTYADAVTGRITRERVDARVRDMARRVVARARMQLDVRGVERVPPDGAYVYMSNHQSHLDIPVLYATVPSPTLRMVAKKELFRIPVWGRAMRAAEIICVDRSDHQSAVDSLREAGAQIADGVSVWIAPEGTRSRTGALGPLKKGGFHLAADTGTPIVPIAIDGTRHVLPADTIRMAHDVPVAVTFGAPIPVQGREIPSLMAEVEDFLRAHVDEDH